MTDRALANRYQQYKAGIATLVNWLAITAQRSGDLSRILAWPKHDNKHATEERKVRVKTSELIKMAQVIVDASTVIPGYILQLLRKVIQACEECASWYSSFANPLDANIQNENDSHRHFIKVLRDIESTLKPYRSDYMPSPTPITHGTCDETPEGDSLTNIFSYLELEEPSADHVEDCNIASGVSHSTTAHTMKDTTAFELDDQADQMYVALWCFFKDLHDLRMRIRNVWGEYKAGELSFAAAGITSSAGMILLSHAADDLQAEHASLYGGDIAFSTLGLEAVQVNNEVFIYPKDARDQHTSGSFDPEIFCPRAWILLHAFRRTSVVEKDRRQYYEDPGFEIHPLGRHLKKIVASCPPFEEVKPSSSGAAMDMFLESLHDIACDPHRQYRLRALAACQITMDVYDIVGPTPEYEMDHYFRAHQNYIQSLNNCTQSVKDEILKMKNAGNDSHLVEAQTKAFENLNTDLHVLKAHARDSYSSIQSCERDARKRPKQNFYLHRILPMWTGLIVGVSAMVTYRHGIESGNGSCTVLSTAYLYKAARLAGVLTREWPDMEMLIKTQSTKRPLVLEHRDGISKMYLTFALALGAKLGPLAKEPRRLPDVSYITQHGRSLETGALPKYSGRGLQVDIFASYIEGLESLERQGYSEVRHILHQYRKTGKLSPAQLFLGAKQVATAATEVIGFDHIGLSMTCQRLLREVFRKCGHALHSMITSIEDKNSYLMYETVYFILLDAASKTRRGSVQKSSFLYKARKVLDDVIQQEGHKWFKPDVYKTVLFGPELPPSWTENDQMLSLIRSFVGLSKNHRASHSVYCVSREDADCRADLYKLYLQWRSGDKSVIGHRLKEAVSKVALLKRQKQSVSGSEQAEEDQDSLDREENEVLDKLGLSQDTTVASVSDLMLELGH